METVIVIGKRPTKIPLSQVDRAQQSTSNGDQLIGADWIICNAPRPIVGHVEWRGEFTSGVFYAAIDPSGERREWMLKENNGQHAVVLVYWTIDDVRIWLRLHYEAEPEVDMEDVKALTDSEAIETFLGLQHSRKVQGWLTNQ
jgi:hypothetical protein